MRRQGDPAAGVVQDKKAKKRETVTANLGTGTDLFSRDRVESSK